ncbi:coiled-coil domain-containing protein 18 [Eublepharis macularius]|uniref:Coiled-coil domain-containing protein 18 n=1 Tax=Eublepharis macularius TaxID=481883 RepID=A0AA97JI55_EUBMA|nr:coiled-coil domain-containing protein 18 [Eublepharis macularius]
MESNLSACHDYHEDEENLLASVMALRNQLRKTERNLENLGEELFSSDSYDYSDQSIHGGELEVLTMEDLVYTTELQNSSAHNTASRTPLHKRDSRRKYRNKSYSVSFDKSMEEENEQLRDKLNVVREQNTLLTSQNYQLMNEIESINFEMNQSKARISFLESALGTHSVSIPMLEDQIESLEAEVQAQDNVLKETEDKLAQSHSMVMEKEFTLQKFKEEYKKMKHDLIERSKHGKRAEQQRNEALHNAEELTRTFKKYKEKITEKLEKVQDEEQILERKLMNCVKEKETLKTQCDTYRNELENAKEQVRKLVEENCVGKESLKCIEAKTSELQSLLTHSQGKILMLESRLQEQNAVVEAKHTLMKENADLKVFIAQQNDHLKSCHQEIENLKTEKNVLENVALQSSQNSPKEFESDCDDHHSQEASCTAFCDTSSSLIEELRLKLQMKDAEIQKLVANKLAQDFFDGSEGQKCSELHGSEVEPVKLTGDPTVRKCQQSELISNNFEKEKQKLIRRLNELHSKLEKSEKENSSIKADMAQRTSQFKAIQEELLEKAAKSANMERVVARKSSKISALEKQLEEKTVVYTTAAARNTELEQDLVEVRSQLHNLERNIAEEHEQFIRTLEKTKLVHLEQHKEMENQNELLQSQLETKNQQFLEQEKTLSILHQEIICKQCQLESLDRQLLDSKEAMEKQNAKNNEVLKMLQGQLTEETVKVRQLQTALDICKEDLALYLSRLEENKESFEKQLKKKSEEVQRLQKELKIKNDNFQATCEQNLLLQQTLQQQQQMLHQETIRNGDLEDSQARLQKQLLKLEQELQKQKENLEEELRKTNEKLHLASEENDLKRQKVAELTSTIRQIKMEMDQCKDELIDMEQELVHLRRDSHAKAMQLGHLEMVLEQRQSELRKKTQQVKILEEKLLQSEMQQKEAVQKRDALETDLENANEEQKTTLRQLEELQEMLKKAQMSLEEKYAAIQDLSEELRECKDDIEDKKQELIDMDQALKERNWELKQRAAQVTQLDMTIREHRGEMEQKIIRLEGNLEKAELQIRDCNKQVESLESKLHKSNEELHQKDFDILQQGQEIIQLKKEIERKQQRITDIEKIVKEREKCIADQHKEVLDLGQQLRLQREQMKCIHVELLESRRQLAQAQREADRLSHELEEMNHLSHEKEARANYLAEELGAAQAREAQLEARMQSEAKRLSAEIRSLKESYKSEKHVHETERTKWQQSTESQVSKSHHLNGQLKQLELELEDAQGTVCNLQQQLESRNVLVQAANEALLLKESEVTRLQTRIAGHERTEGIKQLSVLQEIYPHLWSDDKELNLAKHSEISYTKHRKLCHSTSASDVNVKDGGDSLHLKEIPVLDSSVTCNNQKDTTLASQKSLGESSFDPLTYTVDEDVTCDGNDFHTLSGMLKYINKEMKKSENSCL